MAYDIVERLKKGDANFLHDLSYFNINELIKLIRQRKDYQAIIDGLLDELKDSNPFFLFEIIYDKEKYKEQTLWLLENYRFLKLDKEKIKNLFANTMWGKEYILSNFDEFKKDGVDELLSFILEVLFQQEDCYHDWLFTFSRHSDLHIRSLFMLQLIQKHPNMIPIFYQDITKYMTSVTYQKNEQLSLFIDQMDQSDLSEITYACLEANLDKKIYSTLKEMLITKYPENDLAKLLLKAKQVFLTENSYTFRENEMGQAIFLEDCDRLFTTSRTYQFEIMKRYEDKITKELLTELKRLVDIFTNHGQVTGFPLQTIFEYGLMNPLKLLVQKYMDLSKDKTTSLIGYGTTSHCYRIGDYSFKLIKTKWSYEDVICPNSYLIIKNLEEIYIRNRSGIVCAGLEVQKCLTKKVTDLPQSCFTWWKKALQEEGYYLAEMLRNGPTGDNSFLLDGYLDADCDHPENLPDFFKKTPLVLVDRDRVYKLNNRNPKQLTGRY